jgi:hypothetical protein
MLAPSGIPYTRLAVALRAARFLHNHKDREWVGMRGNSILRIAIHMDRDLAALYIDTPGEPPSTEGRLMSFGQVMDLASASPEAVEARIKAEAERALERAMEGKGPKGKRGRKPETEA